MKISRTFHRTKDGFIKHNPRRRIIKLPSKKMGGYAGMNDEAAKVFGFKPALKPNQIVVDKNLPKGESTRTIKHEIIEEHLMRTKNYPYWKAHEIALKHENDSYKKISNEVATR